MSQLATPVRVPRVARGTVRRPERAPLRVVTGTVERASGGMFVGFCVALMAAGLLAVLVLNTALDQGAFVLAKLEAKSAALTDTADAMEHTIGTQSAPAMLAQRALALGMVPEQAPAFLRLSDGKVLGVAQPATQGQAFTVITSPVPVVPPTTPAPRTTVTKQGPVTTTTVVTALPNGKFEVAVTKVDALTKTTTVTTQVLPTDPTAAATAAKAATPAASPTSHPVTPPMMNH